MSEPKHQVEFIASGRGKAQCPPDPAYPKGIPLDAVGARNCPSCTVELPYPAPECGMWRVDCTECGMSVLVSAAGRPDDPISVKLPCLRSVN